MWTKINCWTIIRDHCQTLKDQNTGRVGVGDVVGFGLLPLVIAGVLVYFGVYLSDGLINILITSLAIFVGLLLNLLVILFDIITKSAEKDVSNHDPLRLHFLREIYANLSFSVFLSVATILLLALSLTTNLYVRIPANIAADALLVLFIITLLMVLKRVHVLLSSEFAVKQ